MTLEELEELFGEPAVLRWVPLTALKQSECLSCIDGRHSDFVIAAPGGDLGEFVVLLAALEGCLGHDLASEDVEAAIVEVMEWHSRFYMHTDDQALGALAKALQQDARFAHLELDSRDDVYALTRHPPQALRGALEEYLVQPEHVGCGHLRLMLERPDRYGVRKDLVQAAILAFYRQMWSGSTHPNYVSLPGQHEEEAVLSVEVEGEPDSSLYVPAVRGRTPGPSRLFINHVPARHYLRRDNLRLLAGAGLLPPDVELEPILERAERLATRQMNATVQALASHLPAYRVEFARAGNPPRIERLSD